MNTIFSAHHYEITREDQEYALEKAEGLAKFVSENSDLKIEFTKDAKHKSGEIFRADMTAISGGSRTHAVGHGSTMREALDKAKDELKRRITKVKRKKTKISRAIGAKVKKLIAKV